MKNYEFEILKIDNINSYFEKMDNEPLLSSLYEISGILLVQLQKVEFIIQGIVSHFNEDILKRNKQFEKLTPGVFLDNDEHSKKKRKQTLGNIIKMVTDNNDFYDTTELNCYVENRNIFIHSMWRDFLSGDRIENRENILKCLQFLILLSKENHKWRSLFNGFLYGMAKIAAKNENKEFTNFERFEQDYVDLQQYIKEQKNIC